MMRLWMVRVARTGKWTLVVSPNRPRPLTGAVLRRGSEEPRYQR
jgi:hypothetical protein